MDTILALVAIGRRTSRLRGEITKALHAAPTTARTPHAQRLREVMGDAVKAMCAAAIEMLDTDDTDDTELDDWIVKVGMSLLADDNDTEPPLDVPPDVARAVVHSYTDGLTDGRRAARSLALVAAAVRGPPEQFYFERHLLDVFHTPWEPALTELLLAPHRKVERATHRPAQRAKAPGPNEPCFCGAEEVQEVLPAVRGGLSSLPGDVLNRLGHASGPAGPWSARSGFRPARRWTPDRARAQKRSLDVALSSKRAELHL